MAERMSERVFWWVVLGAAGVGILAYTTLVAVAVWGIFAGPPAAPGQ